MRDFLYLCETMMIVHNNKCYLGLFAEFAEGNYHDGFVVVGADQLVHYITLFFIYTYIIWQTQN